MLMGELITRTGSMFPNGLDSVRSKGRKTKFFRIINCVRQGCVIVPLNFSMYMGEVKKEVKREVD